MRTGQAGDGSTCGKASGKKEKRHLPVLMCLSIIYGISWEMHPQPFSPWPPHTHCPGPPAQSSQQKQPQPRQTLLPTPRFIPISLTQLPLVLQRGGTPPRNPQGTRHMRPHETPGKPQLYSWGFKLVLNVMTQTRTMAARPFLSFPLKPPSPHAPLQKLVCNIARRGAGLHSRVPPLLRLL